MSNNQKAAVAAAPGSPKAANQTPANSITASPGPQLLPHSRENEESLLGAVLINPDALLEVIPLLQVDDFYIHCHRWVWEAVLRLNEGSRPIDLLTVANELQAHSKLEDVGGMAYLTGLINVVPSSFHAVDYARTVADFGLRRRAIATASEIAKLAYKTDVPFSVTGALESLETMLQSAKIRKATLEHLAFYGPPGLGKTTLAQICAQEMGGKLRELTANSVGRVGDIISLMAALDDGDVLFIDEIHALKREHFEILYPAMEDFKVGVPVGEDKPPITLRLNRFCLIGSTTDFGLLPEPLRARFGQIFHLQYYTLDELKSIVLRAADRLGLIMDEESAEYIAQVSRGTPREALRLTLRARDEAIVRDEFCTIDITRDAIDKQGIDELGLTQQQRDYMAVLARPQNRRGLGVTRIARMMQTDPRTVADVVEPWLVYSGLVNLSDSGRQLTRKGFAHLGLPTTPPLTTTDTEVNHDHHAESLRQF